MWFVYAFFIVCDFLFVRFTVLETIQFIHSCLIAKNSFHKKKQLRVIHFFLYRKPFISLSQYFLQVLYECTRSYRRVLKHSQTDTHISTNTYYLLLPRFQYDARLIASIAKRVWTEQKAIFIICCGFFPFCLFRSLN